MEDIQQPAPKLREIEKNPERVKERELGFRGLGGRVFELRVLMLDSGSYNNDGKNRS